MNIPIRVFLLSLVLTLSMGVHAREVDNYLAWGVDLVDSGPYIDVYMRKSMLEAMKLEKVRNRNPPPGEVDTMEDIVTWYSSCYGAAERLMNEAFYRPTYQKIEEFIDEGNGLDIYPRLPSTDDDEERARIGQTPENGYMTNLEYIRNSVVGTSPINMPLSRIVNAYGVYAGADKFGHFTSFGRRYIKQFVKLVEAGVSEEDAFKEVMADAIDKGAVALLDDVMEEAFDEVMDRGHSSEKSFVGMMFTNVFSRGDLEANYQGSRFAWSLCSDDSREGSNVRLTFDGEAWKLQNVESFTMKDYVNPNWDESYHNSIFAEGTWENYVTPMFTARNDCAKLHSPWVESQRAFYETFSGSSGSTEHGETWIPDNFRGKGAARHSLDTYCATGTPAAFAPVSPAESGNPLDARDNEWRFTIAFPMLWAPDISGEIRGGQSIDFDIPFRELVEELKFGVMLEIYANRGPYGLAFRSTYMRMEDDDSDSTVSDTRVRTGMDMATNDLLASFRIHDKVRLVTGIRHMLLKMELDIYDAQGNSEVFDRRVVVADENKFDLLLGINFNHWFSDKWGLMLNADLGVVGDIDRDFSVDIRGLYRISNLNNLWLGFRYLQIGSDSTENDISYQVEIRKMGPTIGWAFTF